MTRFHLNRVAAVVPLAFSAAAFAIVMANILAGVPPQPDENASAHMWQLLIVAQAPLILVFLATAEWDKGHPAILLGAQIAGIALACTPVWVAEY